jgi:hypothetical protein
LVLGGREFFDREIRNEEHFYKALRYIENNPVKARFARRQGTGLTVAPGSERGGRPGALVPKSKS